MSNNEFLGRAPFSEKEISKIAKLIQSFGVSGFCSHVEMTVEQMCELMGFSKSRLFVLARDPQNFARRYIAGRMNTIYCISRNRNGQAKKS